MTDTFLGPVAAGMRGWFVVDLDDGDDNIEVNGLVFNSGSAGDIRYVDMLGYEHVHSVAAGAFVTSGGYSDTYRVVIAHIVPEQTTITAAVAVLP